MKFYMLVILSIGFYLTPFYSVNAPQNTPQNKMLIDTDGDGIEDNVDLDDDNDGIPDAIECGEVYCGENLVNGSFEQPIVSNGTWLLFHESNVPGWNTTASDGQIELWRSGFLGVPAAEGNQLAELNANEEAAFYQELCISGGSRVQWSVKHRGRNGVDVAQVRIGADLTSAAVIQTMSDGTSWGTYTGTYDVPLGQDTTFFIFEAVSTSSGGNSVGNLIDDIVITILNEPVCTTDFDGDGIPNSFDLDSDNDGIYDIVESGNGHLDTNNDGIIDGANINSGTNGLFNDIETAVDNGVITFTVPDTDSDGYIDLLDLDSDNDNCLDVIEAGYSDPDNNGILGSDPVLVDMYGVVTSGTDGYTTPLDGDSNVTFDFQEFGNNIAIANQPLPQTDCKGEEIIFEIITNNPSVTAYQWEVNTGGGWSIVNDGANHTGSNSNELHILNAPVNFNGYLYRVQLSNTALICDSGLVSNQALLTVYDTPEPTGNATQIFCDIDNATIADLSVTGTDIKWYDSPTGGNLLTTGQSLVHNSVYYATQTLDNCESQSRFAVTAEIYETVVPLPTASITPLERCDTLIGGTDTDGITSFNLRANETLLLNGKNASDFNFRYFTDATRLVSSEITGAAITDFSNTASPNAQTIYVRIENNAHTDCYTDTAFGIIVHPLPVLANAIVDLRQCDDDSDGFSAFNLTEANQLISLNHLNETFTYYETQAEADSGLASGQIPNVIAYSNATALNDVIYARVETLNGCYRTAQINLIVGVSQIPPTFATLQYYACDDKTMDNDNTNGITNFDFSDAEQTIKNLFPLPHNFTVTFYNNEADALAELNAIPDISNHRNEGYPSSQDIYVRIDSDDVNACLGLGHHITLTVDPLPIKQTIIDYVLCSNTNEAVFNLTTKTSEVISGQTRPILVTYHESEQDAINNIAITNPTNYASTAKTIYVRAQFDDNNNGILDARECVSTEMSFNLAVNSNPIITLPDPIRICSEQNITLYNLTQRENQITNNDSSITLEYFESITDLNNNTPITAPEDYTTAQLDTDIIVLATGANGCTSSTTLSLKTILYPNLNKTPLPIEECEIDNDGYDNFNLRRRESDILNMLDATDFIFTYYQLEADAIASNSNHIGNPENFTNTDQYNQTLYARVQPVDNECFQVVPISIVVNQVPEIAIEGQYVICLNSNDTSIPPMLNTFLPYPPIDTQLSETDFSFQWYNDTQGIPANIINGATSATYIPVTPGDYTVVATNRLTGCTIPATTEVVASYPPESITVELVSDLFSGNNILKISVVGNGEYEYKLDITDWQNDSRFENVRGGERTVSVRDLYNCDEIQTFKIIIDYPKFFTPNNDGYNDTWNIRGIETQPEAKIYIFDRYGKLLKKLSPIDPGWDGVFKGQLMPVNDYWFTVEYQEPKDNTSKIFKAHFTLKR